MKHDVLYCKRVGVINMYRLLRCVTWLVSAFGVFCHHDLATAAVISAIFSSMSSMTRSDDEYAPVAMSSAR